MGNNTTVGDYVTLQRGITYKGNLVGRPGPALLGLGSIHPGGGFREGDYKTYGGECPPKIMIYPGDLFASLKGATKDGKMIGSVARVPLSVSSGRLTQDTVKLEFNDPNRETSNFLYWILRTPQYRDYCARHATGSAVVALSRDDFLNYPVPPIDATRVSIVTLLEALEEKCELNRQMNATLELMAQAQFNDWFVDFAPVIDNALAAGYPVPEPLHTKAEIRKALGDKRKPLPAKVRNLFPSSFVFSDEMGWIPEGWTPTVLDRIAHYQNGLALQKFRPEKEADFLPVVKIAQLKKGYADGEEKASPNIKSECVIDDGDVVFSWSGSLFVDVWCGGKAALNQHLFKVTSPEFPKWFYYEYTKHHLIEFQRIASDKAVTMGHIKREHLSQAVCLVPPPDLLEQCSLMLASNVDRQVELRIQSRHQEKLICNLLPKLISGQLRNFDAEKMVKKVLA